MFWLFSNALFHAVSFTHRVFSRFHSGCSGSFLELLELPEWSVHMGTGVFGIGGGHPSQWVVGAQWKWSASVWCLGTSGEMLKWWKLKLTAEPNDPKLSLLEPEQPKMMLLEQCLSELEQPKQKIPKTWCSNNSGLKFEERKNNSSKQNHWTYVQP